MYVKKCIQSTKRFLSNVKLKVQVQPSAVQFACFFKPDMKGINDCKVNKVNQGRACFQGHLRAHDGNNLNDGCKQVRSFMTLLYEIKIKRDFTYFHGYFNC